MPRFSTSGAASASALAFLLGLPLDAGAEEPSASGPLAQAATPAARPAAPAPAASEPTQQLGTIDVVGTRQRLDAARNGLQPETGSTIYRYSREDLLNLPLGDSTSLNQVLLQAPGVVQDSYGQLHVRGDHANVQYRINGVVIPESISGFGQSLETRFANNINFLTGALPAQYGYRTAAIVDVQTKGDFPDNGGAAGILGGSHRYREGNLELHGNAGAFSYFVNGSLLRSDLGIENPTAEKNALHDSTQQGKGFAYLSYLLDPTSRVSLLLGSSDNRFEIPNIAGQTPAFGVDGAAAVDSAALDARQRERNRFAVLSYQGSLGARTDYQVSLFNRWTDVHYRPDRIGDLSFFGIAADITRRNVASGAQADLSYRLSRQHTLRAGFFFQHETYNAGTGAAVFPANDEGEQTSGLPFDIRDDSRIVGNLGGVYLQDEWQPWKMLTINYGLRYDKVSTVVRENQLAPRLGAVYEVSADLRLHAGYARYFTPPPTEKIDTTSVAKFAGTTNALPSDANTAVKSERSDYFDVGAAFQLTREITLGIDAYHRRVRHLQDEGQFGNALIFSAFNYERGRISGLELTASYKDKALGSYVNLGATRARGRSVETGQFNFDPGELAYIDSHDVHLDHEQRLSASAGVSYRFASGLTLAGDALYGSGLRNGFANTEHLPSYAQFNLTGAQALDLGRYGGKVDLRLSVLNIFDRSYELRDGSGIGVGAPQFGPRRTYVAGLSKTF